MKNNINLNIKISNKLFNKLMTIKDNLEKKENQTIKIDDLIEESIINNYNINLIDLKDYSDNKNLENYSNYYYIYIFLNGKKKGVFEYEDYIFDYEPFYIGIGYGNRMESNEKKSHNKKVKEKIKDLKNDFIKIKIKENLNKEDALILENNIINKIGKIANKKGPLLNIISGGDLKEKKDFQKKLFIKDLESFKNYEIIESLNKNNTIKEAAKELKISERTLFRKIKALNLYKDKESKLFFIKKD